MSAGQGSENQIVGIALEMAVEPSYLSEIVRKINNNVSGSSTNVDKLAQIASAMQERDGVELFTHGYDENRGQSEGSPHFGPNDDGDEVGTKTWQPHTIMHNTNTSSDEVRQEVADVIDPTVTVAEKRSVIDTLSGQGNTVSRQVENITQAVLQRQFRNYNTVESGDYNDPGVDFFVSDPDQRDYALAIEVSARYENPIDSPYVDTKKDMAFDDDADLLVLAPAFTDNIRGQYEVIEDGEWHRTPENEIVHLHRVPVDTPEVYRPFAFGVPPEYEREDDGFPVVLPDSDRVADILSRGSKVGGPYPVVNGSKDAFIGALERVERDFRGISESGFRNQIREAIEPLLHEFSRPYTIEQYLVDTYWDMGMTQGEIGRLNGVSDRTISEWMSDRKWNIATRGTNTPISQDTVEIWKKMYRGEPPFPREMTGYEIQSLYNHHPDYNLRDWRQWYALDEETRARSMSVRTSPLDNVSFSLMLNDGERLFPSYDFIINTLRSNGIDIRDGFFNETGTVYPTGKALEYMLNRNIDTLVREGEAGQLDVVEMRSDLEVQVAEWFSENEIPFGYEPFKVPSSYGGVRDNLAGDGVIIDEFPTDNLNSLWASIYNKHNLDEYGDVGVDEGLDIYNKREIVPDFALYPNAGTEPKGQDWEGWMGWSHIIEVSGPYGAPPPNDWLSWYRVGGVAYKELAYKLMGLWGETYFVVTNDRDIPQEVRDDEHYVVISPTQTEVGLDGLGNILGLV
jgi:hypothetical protein